MKRCDECGAAIDDDVTLCDRCFFDVAQPTEDGDIAAARGLNDDIRGHDLSRPVTQERKKP